MTANLQAAHLKACESIIEAGQRTFVEVGQALAKIREHRLFREAGFSSFDDYCRERWGMGKRYASYLISGSEMGTMVPEITNARQARALARVAEPQRVEVMQRAQQVATEREQPVTAAVIEEVAQQGNAVPRPKCAHCEVHCP